MFGDYDRGTATDLDSIFDGDDSVWEAPKFQSLEPGKYQLRLVEFEKTDKIEDGVTKSEGFTFTFAPYAYEDGTLVPEWAAKLKIKKYFNIKYTDKNSGKLTTSGFANVFTQFLLSIGVNRDNNKQKFNNESLVGTLVWAGLVLGDKKPTTKADPETGIVPEFDPDDHKTYIQFLQIDNNPLVGIRVNGNVQKVYA